MPLPAFLALHVARELSLAFASDVTDVARKAPGSFAALTALLLVWLPLAVHVAAATILLLRGRLRQRRASDVPAIARAMSAGAALLTLLFVIYHAQTFSVPVWLGEAAAEDAGFRLLGALSSTSSGVPLIGGAYLLGLLASVSHAALGVHRGLLAEGLLSTPQKRLASARACAGGGALLFVVGAAAVIRVASGVLLR